MMDGADDRMTRADIRRLIEPFYQRVRGHPRLGPMFESRIGVTDVDWAPHMAKIENFWASVMLKDGSYSGSPMQAHAKITEIRPADFAIWLGIFEQTARDTLSTAKADAICAMARRIGASLQMGVENARNRGGAPKLLRS